MQTEINPEKTDKQLLAKNKAFSEPFGMIVQRRKAVRLLDKNTKIVDSA